MILNSQSSPRSILIQTPTVCPAPLRTEELQSSESRAVAVAAWLQLANIPTAAFTQPRARRIISTRTERTWTPARFLIQFFRAQRTATRASMILTRLTMASTRFTKNKSEFCKYPALILTTPPLFGIIRIVKTIRRISSAG